MIGKEGFRFDVVEWNSRLWFTVGAIAWVGFAVTAWFFMTAATRTLTLSLLTGGAGVALAYEWSRKGDRQRWLAASLVSAWAIGAVTLYVANRFGPRTAQISGPLVPGSLRTPRTACEGDAELKAPGRLLMIFGRDGVIGEGSGPFTPARVGTCPILTIRRAASGLVVDAFGFDSDDNVVYRIRANRFEQIIGGFLKGARPDKSTLAILDDRDVQVAAIRYLNRNAVQISGTFRCGDTKPVRIAEAAIRIGSRLVGPHLCVHIDSRVPYGLVYSDRGP